MGGVRSCKIQVTNYCLLHGLRATFLHTGCELLFIAQVMN